MLEIIGGAVGPAFIFVLLLGLMWLTFNFRRATKLTRQQIIKASPEKVFNAIDPAVSDFGWRQLLVNWCQLDGGDECYRFFWQIKRAGDGPHVDWTQDFIINKRVENSHLVMSRSDLDKSSHDDKILRIEAKLTPVEGGTKLEWCEDWGRRSLAGQFAIHIEAAQVMGRLQDYCQSGKVSHRRSAFKAGWISGLSALATLAAFSVLLGWKTAILFIIVLAVHEFGHLLSFRMVGQPWGRVLFVPFIGAMAVSRMPHHKLSADVFCALMGAGFSIVLLVPALIASGLGYTVQQALSDGGWPFVAFALALLTGAINLLNLLPIFPLDGGRYFRAVLQSFAPGHIGKVMLFLAGFFAILAVLLHNIALVAFALIPFLQKKRLTTAREGVALLDWRSMSVMSVMYLALIVMHGGAIAGYWQVIMA